jgi:putative membrane protein
MHTHADAAMPLDLVIAGLGAVAVVAYLAGVAGSHRRGRPWHPGRSVLWCAGVVAAAASVAGPLAAAAHEDFTAHMWTHLLGGMIAPLLLVLAAPVTLALRTLAVTPARRLSRMLRSAPARTLAHPVPALILSTGGLWLIYLTPVFAAMRTAPLAHLVVHAHLLAAGYLFTAAIIDSDPRPHRSARPLRAGVLLVAVAAHGILAKHLYASPPSGVTDAAAAEGAQLMYYAGAGVEAAIIVIFCAQWYRAAGKRMLRTSAQARVAG